MWLAAAAAVVLVAAAGGTAFALRSRTSGTAGAGQPQAKVTLRQVAASSRPTLTASSSASARHTTAKPTPVTLAPAEADPAEGAPAAFAPATAAPVTAAPATSAPVKHTAAPVVHKTTPAPVTVTVTHTSTAPAPPPVTYAPPSPVSAPVTTSSKAKPPKPTSAVVPSVFGENLAGAEASLKAAGFTNYSWAYECYGSANITDVVSQAPVAGSTIALTAPVHINLQASNCATMPDVVGFQISNAVSILKGLGFTGPTITWRFSCYAGTVPINRVMTQSPAAGTSYGKNQLISLGVEANNCK